MRLSTTNSATEVGPRPSRVEIKLGTALLTTDGGSLDKATISNIVRQITRVHSGGVSTLIVTSGAVAAGKEILDRSGHPFEHLSRITSFRQVMASLGQTQLMHLYEELFANHGIIVGQALVSRSDLQSRLGYLNVRNTLETLLDIKAIPIINENDVVAVEELENEVFGDNDRLSAMVANVVDADLLILLGEMSGLYTADPYVDPKAQLIRDVKHIDLGVMKSAGQARDGRGRGGMASKVDAARLATSTGTEVVIASGHEENVVLRLCQGERLGTTFFSSVSRLEAKKRWIMTGVSESRGSIVVDGGAVNALRNHGKSLLLAGVVSVIGDFSRGDIIAVNARAGEVLGWGLANYASHEIDAIKKHSSSGASELLVNKYGPEVIHRNNLALQKQPSPNK